MRRLLPEPADDISVEDAYSFALGDRPGRPWVGLCMVASIDGSTVVGGNSAGLSSETDAAVLGRLRRLADVIIVGAGTVRDEGYGAPRKPGQRVGVITRTGKVDLTSELFSSGAGFLVTSGTSAVDARGIDIVRAGQHDVDLNLAVERIAELIPSCRYVQAEGGAALNGALLDADATRRDQPDDVTGHRRRRRPSLGGRRRLSTSTASRSANSPSTSSRSCTAVGYVGVTDFSSNASSRWKSAAASKSL